MHPAEIAQSLADARRVVGAFVDTYNGERLHGAIGYITPHDRLAGRHQTVFAGRRVKMEAARKIRTAQFAKIDQPAEVA